MTAGSRGQPIMAVLLAAGILTAGCGTAAPAAARRAVAPPAPLASSLVTLGGAWAVVPMGANPAFWQLVVLPAADGHWSLATPPGAATNGGLVIADLGGRSLVSGIRPSQHLAFSPLAATADDGKTWSPGILGARLADVPDALAAAADGGLFALLTDGTVEQSSSSTGGSGWTVAITARALAASPAGRPCGVTELTAVAFGGPGIPLLAAACARPGTAGVFALVGGVWRAVGPALPASLAGRVVTVLRLATAGATTVALLAAGTGPQTVLLAAWTSDAGARWALSPPLAIGAAAIQSSGLGSGGAVTVLLSGGSSQAAQALGGPGAAWRPLPTPPAGTLTLVAGSAGQFDALAARGTTKLTDWRLDPRSGAWRAVQTISVPIQFGSSG